MGWRSSFEGALTLLLVLLLVASCTRAEQPKDNFRVESSSSISFASFNNRLDEAAAKGDSWTQDPIRIAVKFLDSHGAPWVRIQRNDQGGEMSDATTIIVVEDGYRDDSVRGSWTQLKLKRLNDGTWRISDIQKAYRCWRGHHRESYSAQLCP
jgi:hypothetical protein